MREVILKLIIPGTWIKDISHKYRLSINCIECMPYGKFGGRGLFEIKGESEELKKIIDDISHHPNVYKVEMCNIKEDIIIGSIFSKECVACRALTESDCYLVSGKCLGDGCVEWKLITGDDRSLSSLIENLEEKGCVVALVNANKINHRIGVLTKKQEKIIRKAFEKGYYDYPKKINIKELSNLFSISPSTLGEILQRGEKKVIFEYFKKLSNFTIFHFSPEVFGLGIFCYYFFDFL